MLRPVWALFRRCRSDAVHYPLACSTSERFCLKAGTIFLWEVHDKVGWNAL